MDTKNSTAPRLPDHELIRLEAAVNNFTAPAPPSAPECFACYEGVVYLGHLVEDEDGDTAEVFEPVPCRRCDKEERRNEFADRAAKIAGDAIDLFLEYRDRHDRDEDSARHRAVAEVWEGCSDEALEAVNNSTAPRLPDHELIRRDAAEHPERSYREHVEAARTIAARTYREDLRRISPAANAALSQSLEDEEMGL